MFSFSTVKQLFQSTPTSIHPNEIIDKLGHASLTPQDQAGLVNTLAKNDHNRHGNNYLLQALAWNRLKAAKALLALDQQKVSINTIDSWPTCLNTPLILASKINATTIIKKLITLGAEVDKQDYRGFSALHYACIMRNHEAIQSLLQAGASTHIKDAFGKLPLDYYQMSIQEADLSYSYGVTNGSLRFRPDRDNHYFATKKRCLSALRWYIGHIIVNNQWGQNTMYNGWTVYDYAFNCLKVREPIYDAAAYTAAMRLFCEMRPALDQKVVKKITPDPVYFNAYNSEKYDRYRLFTMDLIPAGAAHLEENDEVWVELPERHSTLSS